MQSCYVWFLVIVACSTDAVTDDKAAAKSQQQADLMQSMANGNHLLQSSAPSQADGSGFIADQLGLPVMQPGGYMSKRAHNKPYGFGLGKRLYRQYEFGLGKRSTSKQYGFGLGKRAAFKQYEFGLGKRASPTFYSFGLGRRASPQYSFGLGKRVSNPSYLNVDDREADYTYNDLSEEKKRTSDDMGHGQRFAFGLGKRGAEWGDDDVQALAAPMWHPAVRRARLQYSFGLGKRADNNNDDYDALDSEYAAEQQLDDFN